MGRYLATYVNYFLFTLSSVIVIIIIKQTYYIYHNLP